MNWESLVVGVVTEAVRLGLAASEAQARRDLLAHLQASPAPADQDYWAARGEILPPPADRNGGSQ